MRDGSVTLAGEAPLFRARFAPDELAPLFDLLNEAAPARVMVHQLLGYDAGFLARLETWLAGREAVYYLHDFYPLCPRVTFIDATGEFCDLAETARCERCLALDGAHEASRLGLAPAEHRAAFERLLQVIHRVVTPSASAASYLRRGFPDVAAEVSPHPGDELVAAAHWGPRPATDPAEILLLGALGPHKGAQRLLDIAKRARLTHPHLRFRVIGYTSVDDDLLPLGNVIITGRYTGESLSPHLAEASGNLALFLHLWPETYSYTLSEALRHGFVPLVPDLGAPAERVRALGIGLVYPRTLDAAGILQLIDAIRAGEVSHAPFRAIERRAAE
jgi:glycosyltransferase involved in cell wall biosynthesis